MSFFTILSSAEVALATGFIYAILAMGYYITYSILDFPDLTVEGTVVSGAACYALLARVGVNPWLALLAAFVIGCAIGSLTGVLHVRLKIRDLLCGILVSTLLISVNLIVTVVGQGGDWTGAGALTSVPVNQTVLTTFPFQLIPASVKLGGIYIKIRELVAYAVIAILIKILLDAFLKTKRGLLLRAAGNNAQYVISLAQDPGRSKILGLALGNGLAAVTGALLCQNRSSTDQSMGIGMIVIGIASVIIGQSVLVKMRRLKPTSKVMVGAILYQIALTIATLLGVPSTYNKALMAVLFTVALIAGRSLSRQKKEGSRC